MYNTIKTVVAAFAVVLALASCSNKQSLQEYYVDNQENGDFILVDVPTSLLGKNVEALSEEQQEVFKTVRKINLMAYQTKSGDTAAMQVERDKVKDILTSDDYEELMKASGDMGQMRLYFKGEEDAIDEVIFFGADDNKGFMLARLLGNDMNIGDMMRMAESLEKSDIDVSQFGSIMEVFDNK
ncbi:DUF4252 domain-containing protein [Dokdonia donghaensis]|uniref:DUF4252 domain-containing protein n=1 Tax=Dokdonia donghaensis DSW-1 TaxID=1300343 RepID=A0A0A2GX53_9FLAO|nr:DUF4252 domain-containing protein [Dokdonia donghaensis]ANH60594.1 hypothetical protein I597_1690 [Dokdonia donghaensis DSW-1]KGO07839.1 hypothetical protein NV36_14020 [Dokdonia donghaensis DSW-1]